MKKILSIMALVCLLCSACSESTLYQGIANVYDQNNTLVKTFKAEPTTNDIPISVIGYCVKFKNSQYQYPSTYTIISETQLYKRTEDNCYIVIYYANTDKNNKTYHTHVDCSVLEKAKKIVRVPLTKQEWEKVHEWKYLCEECAKYVNIN